MDMNYLTHSGLCPLNVVDYTYTVIDIYYFPFMSPSPLILSNLLFLPLSLSLLLEKYAGGGRGYTLCRLLEVVELNSYSTSS